MSVVQNNENVFVEFDHAACKFVPVPFQTAVVRANQADPIYFEALHQMANIPRPDQSALVSAIGNPCMLEAKGARMVARAIAHKRSGRPDLFFIIVLRHEYAHSKMMFTLVFAVPYNTAQQRITEDGMGDKTMRWKNAVVNAQANIQTHLDSLGKRKVVDDSSSSPSPAKKAAPSSSFGVFSSFGQAVVAPASPPPTTGQPSVTSGVATGATMRRTAFIPNNQASTFVSYAPRPGSNQGYNPHPAKFAFSSPATGLNPNNFGGTTPNKPTGPRNPAQDSMVMKFAKAIWCAMMWVWSVVQWVYAFVSNFTHAFTKVFQTIMIVIAVVVVCFIGYFLVIQLWPATEMCFGVIFSMVSYAVYPAWYIVKSCVGVVVSVASYIGGQLWSITRLPFVG